MHLVSCARFHSCRSTQCLTVLSTRIMILTHAVPHRGTCSKEAAAFLFVRAAPFSSRMPRFNHPLYMQAHGRFKYIPFYHSPYKVLTFSDLHTGSAALESGRVYTGSCAVQSFSFTFRFVRPQSFSPLLRVSGRSPFLVLLFC